MASFARAVAHTGLGLALALGAGEALAQDRMMFGRSLALVQVHDDNLFSTSGRGEPDDISRLSPRLVIGRHSRRFTLGARLGLDAEVFGRHRELNTAAARQEAALELDWAPSRRVHASASAAYADVQDAGELNALTGLQIGRVPARRLSTTESLSRRLGARTKATLEHSFTHEEAAVGLGRASEPPTVDRLAGAGGRADAGGPGNAGRLEVDTQAVCATVERRLGRSDRGRVSYRAQRFTFGQEATTSQVVTLGWSRELTPLAHFEIEAGPRVSGHTVGAEVSAGFKHRFQRGDAGVAYLHSQTTVVGQPGPVTTQGVTATLSRQLGGSFQVKSSPSVFWVKGQDSDATVHRLSLEVTWRVTRRLSLAASHHFSLQYGQLGREVGSVEIMHNMSLLQLVAASAGS